MEKKYENLVVLMNYVEYLFDKLESKMHPVNVINSVDNLFDELEGVKADYKVANTSNIESTQTEVYVPSLMLSYYDNQLRQLDDIIENNIKYFKHQLLEKQHTINIEYSNAFVNNIFQYYYDFKNKINCFDATKLLINNFIQNEIDNIKPIDHVEEYPVVNKKHTLSTVDDDKLSRIREQKRNYYLRNKNKFREYQKQNNENIKEYQKNYRNNKLKI